MLFYGQTLQRYACIKLRHSRLWEFHTSVRSVIMLQVFTFIKVYARLKSIGIVRRSCSLFPPQYTVTLYLSNWWWTACVHSERQLASQSWGKGKYRAHAEHNFKWSLEHSEQILLLPWLSLSLPYLLTTEKLFLSHQDYVRITEEWFPPEIGTGAMCKNIKASLDL